MNNAVLCELLGKTETAHGSSSSSSDRILALLAQVQEQLDTNCLDVEDCVSTLVKLLPSHNALVKTAVCDLVVRAATAQPDIGLLVVNTLNRDVVDPNPAVRCTAISTLCSIPGLQEQAAAALHTGFGDSSPSVRVAAVTGVGKVWRHAPSTVQEEGFVDQLYAMLRDTEPAVVTFALQTLNIILTAEGGVVINRAMARHFLGRLSAYPEQEACFMLDYLRQATAVTRAADPELRVEILNRLDPLLDSGSGSLVVAAARLLVRLVEGEDKLVESLSTRLAPLLAAWVRRSGCLPEFQAILLDFLLSLHEPAYLRELNRCLKQLHVRAKDPPEIGRRKVELIAKLATPDNCVEIMNYLLNLVQRPAEASAAPINRAALAGACRAARQDETCYENLLRNLDLLVRTDRAAYFPLVLELVPVLGLKASGLANHEKVATSLVTSLLAAIVPEQANQAVLISALNLLEEFGGLTRQAPQLLEDLWRLDRSGWSAELYQRILAAAYALFVAHPAAVQPVLGRILHTCSLMPNHHLRGLVRVYYQLLKSLVAADS